jgi:gliding motility-associated-like protein
MFKLYISVVLLFMAQSASTQLPVLQWARAFQSHNTYNPSTYNNGRAVGVDQQGNVYTTGLFSYTIDMDPGSGVYDMAGGGPFNIGIYISKLDKNGNFVWAKQIPTYVEFNEIDLKVDKDGNVYVASELRNAADMDPGPGVLMMSPTGFKDAFVIKLDTDGNLIWAKHFGGPGDTGASPTIIEVDKNNNVFVCGAFNNTVDFDPGPGTFNLTSTAHIQSFIVKLNSNGDLIWAKQFGNSPVVYSGSNIVDAKCDQLGNLYTVGDFAGSCDFDPGPNAYTLVAAGLRDGYIAKLTPNGDFIWTKKVTNTSGYYNNFINPRAVEVDAMNNVITAGWFIGTFDFDPGPGINNVTPAGYYDSYILKLNQNGDFIWVKRIGGPDYDTGNDLALDNDNNIYLAGSYGPTVDYDPGPGDHTVTSSYYGPGAIIKLKPDGNFVYAALFESISYGSNLCRRLVVDDAQNVYTGGYLTGTVDFEPRPDVYPLSASPDEAPFVLKLSRCKNITTSTLDISACSNYTLNNEKFDSSGTYTQVIPNVSGCDSIITLHLTLNKKTTHQTKAICEGDFFFAGGANQTISGIYNDTLQTVLGCDSIVTTLLTVNPKPSPDLGPDKNLCSNTTLNITPGSFTSYLWQDMSGSGSFTITTAGKYWVKVTNSSGCTATDTLTIPAIVPAPSNFLKETDSICTYESLEVLSSDPFDSYQWSTGETERRLIVQQPGTYWLTVKDVNGCSGTDSITIFEKKCMRGVYVPSAFTPNNDGKNDVFRPVLFGKVKLYHFAVYNRWGAVIFQTSEPQKGWDGKIAGILQSNAVFVWTCHYQFEGAEPKTNKGTVVLIR